MGQSSVSAAVQMIQGGPYVSGQSYPSCKCVRVQYFVQLLLISEGQMSQANYILTMYT